MKKRHIQDISENTLFELYDARTMPMEDNGLSHFALVDSLMNEAGRRQKSMLHFWPTKEFVFLGMQDTKLPYFSDALSVLDESGYDYIVRNSGGLGVVSDQGILNVSLIIPNKDMDDISIDDGYEIMYSLIQDMLDVPVDAVEIPDSYCPGDFDLSIGGQKISGISQRRRSGALAIMLYLSIEGDQEQRSQMMKRFYEEGLKGEDSKWHFPVIDPDVMVNLDDVLDEPVTVEEIQTAFIESLESFGGHVQEGEYSPEILSDYKIEEENMIKRNERMLGNHFKMRRG